MTNYLSDYNSYEINTMPLHTVIISHYFYYFITIQIIYQFCALLFVIIIRLNTVLTMFAFFLRAIRIPLPKKRKYYFHGMNR